jgi:hypothetical protein
VSFSASTLTATSAERAHRRPDRHAGAEPAEGKELGRERRRCPGDPGLTGPLGDLVVGRAGHSQAGQIALDIGHDDRHAGHRQLLGH